MCVYLSDFLFKWSLQFIDGYLLCNKNYELNETGQFCRPICCSGCGENPLHNCTAPDVCGCVKGYSSTYPIANDSLSLNKYLIWKKLKEFKMF